MRLIYIAGDDRSGSTMLDMMLSGHSNITSVGEAHQLRAYANQDYEFYKSVHKLICMCGEKFSECSFWNGVQKELGRNLGDLDLKLFFLRSDFKGKPLHKMLKKIVWITLQMYPVLYDYQSVRNLVGASTIEADSFSLYEAVSRSVGTEYVLDSSKSLFRLRNLTQHNPEKIKVILLCRDYRGVINSKVKRGVSIFKAAYQWKWCVKQMELFSNNLPAENVYRIKYEDLCNNTEKELVSISTFLNLQFEPATLKRNIDDVHNLGGSPSKYNDSGGVIKLDQTHKSSFSSNDIAKIHKIVANEAAIWGYD